ncbi:hypothetical protein RvY_00167 [Ramazzottius varieornatus]|uniref:Cilia- and flagella-associated protein 206 n=1 Tax=Ramazzottius varieornatus TaxID=947166 RepID=A0A1D1UMB2_RAMVA|nr:hypothetical protein RvY_00167 [Ramazzottius varieornatus]
MAVHSFTVRVSAKADIGNLRQDLLKEVQTVTADRKILTDMVDSAMTDPSSEHKVKGEAFKDALIMLHQYLTNLDLIKNELAETEVVIGRNQSEFAKKVKELQDNCRNERVIAANVVFGCCVVTLVEYPGFLAAGNKSLGLIFYNGHYMCFREADAAERFAQHPEKYMTDLLTITRKRSVLEKLLGLVVTETAEDNIEHLKRRIPYCEDSKKGAVKIDVAIQPELHPVASHWDSNYEWNVDQEVQTNKESGTAAVKPLQYLAGLRGGPEAFNKIRFKQIGLSSDQLEELAELSAAPSI